MHYGNQAWRDDEHGFTLIELLVCMLIISILAAAATQIWFHQRRKGWVAQVHAGVRHMAGAQNSWVYEAEGNHYTLNVSDLEDIGFNYTDDVKPAVVAADSQTFCIQVTSAHDPTIVWHYASEVGYPQEGPADEDECGVGAGSGALASVDTNPGPGDSARDNVGGPGDGSNPAEGPDISGYPPGLTGGGSIGDEISNGGGNGGTTTGTSGGNANGGSGGGNQPSPTTSDPTWDDEPGSNGDGSNTGGGSNTAGGGGGTGGTGDGGCRGGRLDPDGTNNDGRDEIGGTGGSGPDKDCNNGSGNDIDGEDDNNASGKNK